MGAIKRAVVGTVVATAAVLSLAASPANAGVVSPQITCRLGHFCAFSGPNFTGEPKDWFACGVDNPVPWSGVGSWINNQTGGARAQFKSSDGVTRWTSNAPYTDDRNADWSWVWYVRIC